MAIQIVTDSTCDLPKNVIEELNIIVIPLNVFFGEKAYKDGVTLSSDEFYQELLKDEHHPQTSQPSPMEFIETYREIIKKGDEIVSIHLSSKMSGTIQSATIAKNDLESLGENITILDSETVSIQLGSIVMEVAKRVKSGETRVAEIVSLFERLKKETVMYFMVDTLKYLHKGGRIGGASAFVGTILNVKPILTVEDGTVKAYSKARGTKKAILMIRNLILHAAEHGSIVVNGTYLENDITFQNLQKKLGEHFDMSEGLISQGGPVVGTHVGPGAFAIAIVPRSL